jgi:citrate lyase subunit gamma (acyl carrier protein)
MELVKTGAAGTLESGDIYIEIEQGGPGIEIRLQSTVMNLYGRQIREVLESEAKALGVTSATIVANDKGALDCTIRARLNAAVQRSAAAPAYAWTAEGRRA